MEPMICLSITNQGIKTQDLIEEVREIAKYHVDIIEWRVDTYQYRTDWGKVAQTLEVIREELGSTPLLLTFRDDLEGGNMGWTSLLWLEYLSFLEDNVELYDYIDIEMCNYMKLTDDDKTRIREIFYKNQIRLIGSYHNFKGMEEEDIIVNRFRKYLEQEVSIIKMAYQAENAEEVQCLIRAATRCHEIAKLDQVFIPMGNAGRKVRLKPELTFSSIAYCTTKEYSTIGQVTVNEYKKNRIG